MPLLFRFLSEF